jgi:hypothetical protein
VLIDDIFTFNERVARIAEHFRSFVLSSGLPPFDRVCNSGTWKSILIRMTELGESMLVVSTFGPFPDSTVEDLLEAFSPEATSLFHLETRFPKLNNAPFIYLF